MLIDYSVYPEYKNRRFRSILREFKNVIDKGDEENLKDMEKVYLEIESMVDASDIAPEARKTATADDIKIMMAEFEKLRKNPIIKNAAQ